jgi:1-acyl-sn-glycerol-3-phosphate acyltransferase
VARDRVGVAYRIAVGLLRPAVTALARRDWRGLEHLPREGGVVVATNHISYLDPLVVAHVLHDAGRPPRFLAKAGLFGIPVVGWVIRNAGQIPVDRLSEDAGLALERARMALRHGECIVVYPEGTVTREPDLWPMTGKSGAARLALTSGCPLVPLAHWGTHEILPPYALRPRVFPRRTVRVLIGPAVDLSDLAGREITAELLRIATDRLMTAITALLEQLRGETAPAQRYDMRALGVPETGHPRRVRRSA